MRLLQLYQITNPFLDASWADFTYTRVHYNTVFGVQEKSHIFRSVYDWPELKLKAKGKLTKVKRTNATTSDV